MTKTNLSDNIFTIVFEEKWWCNIGSAGKVTRNFSIFHKQSKFKIIDWIFRYLLGVFVTYSFVVLTNAQQVEGGFEYYIRVTSKNYYILWMKLKTIPCG